MFVLEKAKREKLEAIMHHFEQHMHERELTLAEKVRRAGGETGWELSLGALSDGSGSIKSIIENVLRELLYAVHKKFRCSRYDRKEFHQYCELSVLSMHSPRP